MKAKYLWVALLLVFWGCEDNTGGLGMGMLPGSDGIVVDTVSFAVQSKSALSEEVFAKTNIGYVGRFTDTENGFGYYEGSFLTEFNCVDDFSFPKAYNTTTNKNTYNMISDNPEISFESAEIVLGYYTNRSDGKSSFFGDSINPIQLGVYQLQKNLKKNHYTNIDTDEYTDNNKELLGKVTCTAVNLADTNRHSQNYLTEIKIPIPANIGKSLIQTYKDHPGWFKDSDTFINEVFKGIYVKNEAGDGTVLYIQYASLEVSYKAFGLDSLNNKVPYADDSTNGTPGTDSIVTHTKVFASTMEVIQANRIDISDEVKNKVNGSDEQGHTYLKTPAGIYTKAILPINNFVRDLDLENDTINAVELVFRGYHHDTDGKYSMSPPSTVLLIKENEVKDFFEKNQIPNNTTSYVASYSKNQYSFSNITRLVTSYIKEMKEAETEQGAAWDEEAWLKDNQIAIIPVTLGTQQTSSGGGVTITNVQHDLTPAFVKLKGGDPTKGGSLLNLHVTYSKFKQ